MATHVLHRYDSPTLPKAHQPASTRTLRSELPWLAVSLLTAVGAAAATAAWMAESIHLF
jgi:hypothetical protein